METTWQNKLVRDVYQAAAQQCAPVIFGIKPSNLLTVDRQHARVLKSLIDATGLKARCLDHTTDRQVWFLFREEDLLPLLQDPANRDFICSYGYSKDMDMDHMLALLASHFRAYRTQAAVFPHEMGIFLGYPRGDVRGFIENNGRNYLCSGYWKVYENEKEARLTFRRYANVRKYAMDLIRSGAGFGPVRQYRRAILKKADPERKLFLRQTAAALNGSFSNT